MLLHPQLHSSQQRRVPKVVRDQKSVGLISLFVQIGPLYTPENLLENNSYSFKSIFAVHFEFNRSTSNCLGF